MTRPIFLQPHNPNYDRFDIDCLRRRLEDTLSVVQGAVPGHSRPLPGADDHPFREHRTFYNEAGQPPATPKAQTFNVEVKHNAKHRALASDGYMAINFRERPHAARLTIVEALRANKANALQASAPAADIAARIETYLAWLDCAMIRGADDIKADYREASHLAWKLFSALMIDTGFPPSIGWYVEPASPVSDFAIITNGISGKPISMLTPAGVDFFGPLFPSCIKLAIERVQDLPHITFSAAVMLHHKLHQFDGTHDILRTIAKAKAPAADLVRSAAEVRAELAEAKA